MTTYLLAITVGPVQDFIAAARRTRDLWFGSHLLSELSKSVAADIHQKGGKLIFPCVEDKADELNPDLPLNVANVVIAKFHGNESQLRSLCGSAKNAAQERWRGFADATWNFLSQEQEMLLNEEIWKAQVEDVIECYSAWVELTDNDDYAKTRQNLMRLLEARKRLRDFAPAQSFAGVPKSSLDGLRDSVLCMQANGHSEIAQQTLRLQSGEQLDVVGVVKRCARDKGQSTVYPSVARVAAGPWLRKLEKQRLEEFNTFCGTLTERLDSLAEKFPHYRFFPYEGTLIYSSRHAELVKEAGISDEKLKQLTKSLASYEQDIGKPSPYLAILMADGDHIGAVLNRLNCAASNRDFSKVLAGFAANVREIVNTHSGALVYAGGDDVLALVPETDCVACASELASAFSAAFSEFCGRYGLEEVPTLSVGIAIAHFMEPLEDLLNWAREAEYHAKNPRDVQVEGTPRNGLAIHLIKRGGVPVQLRMNWAPATRNADDLKFWLALMKQSVLSTRTAHALHEIADVYEGWAGAPAAIALDALACLRRKSPGLKHELSNPIWKDINEKVAPIDSAASLRRLADMLLIAQQLKALPTNAKNDQEIPA